MPRLLKVIERLETRGAPFRSLQDPIDTGSLQGRFTLQALGEAAEFERTLSASGPRQDSARPAPKDGLGATQG